ncbi:MAG: aspartate/tyrosine/aromatic aminotransferase [Gammaproteobacteria bacterium]|nr:aspartate/tyrosine/aromatic aminotransferase [Gammaproteobacteria bacterium]MCY4357493.1 aspartate/tyrosine/aromatic aminotransferase [Gammaproteobacteria bacterium]
MFETLQPLPADPILGLSAAYRADTNPKKVDLGVGVYKDAAGSTPVMRAIKKAEEHLCQEQVTKAYVAPVGLGEYNETVAKMLLGEDLLRSLGRRRVTVQTPGGCGALRMAADFIRKANKQATVWVSDPTWANHVPLLGSAGLGIEKYPYYDYDKHSVRFDEMLDTLQQIPVGDLVLLHGCCHNPSGADLSREQWQSVRDIALSQGFTVFIDTAYQGLGDGLEEDAYGIRLLAESLPELIVASSCSKNFGLYRERTGALTVTCTSDQSAAAAITLLAAAARANYSMPPDHGASIVQTVMSTPELYADWQEELAEMRNRINGLRSMLVSRLAESEVDTDFSFIEQEKGMFSFLGVGKEQVKKLINEYSIYLVNSSRINVASINENNVDYVVESILAILE